jgi:hypothetical protein
MFLLLATFYILRIAVRPLFGPFLGNYPENFQPQALITISFTQTLIEILYEGPLVFLAVGLLCLSLSFKKAYIGYWSFHLTIWLVGLSAWYRFNSVFLPWPANPIWLIVTLVTSLVLLILYKPITSILRKLVAPVQRA